MRLRHPHGAASVEQAGLVLLIALLLVAAISAIAARGPDEAGPQLGSALARKLRCATRLPGPCWRDPLTEAYGRPLAGSVRALASTPGAVPGPDGSAPRAGRLSILPPTELRGPVPAGRPHDLQPARNRLPPRSKTIAGRGAASRVTYWLYRSGDRLGSRGPHREVRRGRGDGIHAAARGHEPSPGAARDPRRAKPLRLPARARSRPGAGGSRASTRGETRPGADLNPAGQRAKVRGCPRRTAPCRCGPAPPRLDLEPSEPRPPELPCLGDQPRLDRPREPDQVGVGEAASKPPRDRRRALWTPRPKFPPEGLEPGSAGVKLREHRVERHVQPADLDLEAPMAVDSAASTIARRGVGDVGEPTRR